MTNDRLQMIRSLHAFTQAGLADCKRALDDSSGDYFQAVTQLLTPEAFREKDQAFRVRRMCGQAVLDPVTEPEAELMDRLRDHFAAQTVRPHHMFFSTEAFPRTIFADLSRFDRLAGDTGSSWLADVWIRAGYDLRSEHRLPPEGLDVATVTLGSNDKVAVVTMPTAVSEHEVDFIAVRRQPRKFRIFGPSTRIRCFVLCERIHAPDWNLVIAEEIIPKGQELVFKRCPDGESVSTTSEGLAQFVKGFR